MGKASSDVLVADGDGSCCCGTNDAAGRGACEDLSDALVNGYHGW